MTSSSLQIDSGRSNAKFFGVYEVVPLPVILSDMKGCQVYLIFKDFCHLKCSLRWMYR